MPRPSPVETFAPSCRRWGEMLAPLCSDAFLKHFFGLGFTFFLGAVFASLAALVASFFLGWKINFDDLWRFRKNLPKIQGVLEIRQVMSRDEGYCLKMKKDHFWDYFPPKNPVNSLLRTWWKNVSRFQPTFITGPSPSLVVKVPSNLLATLGTFYWIFQENGTKKRLSITGIIIPRADFLEQFHPLHPQKIKTSIAAWNHVSGNPWRPPSSIIGVSHRLFRTTLPTRQECISDLGAFGWSWSGTSVVFKSMLVIWKTCFKPLAIARCLFSKMNHSCWEAGNLLWIGALR